MQIVIEYYMWGDENQIKTQLNTFWKLKSSRVLNLNATEEILKFPKAIPNGVALKMFVVNCKLGINPV